MVMKPFSRAPAKVESRRSPMAEPVPKSAPPQAWLKPSLIAPIVEPVPMIVAPSVQKIKNTFMSRPPVTNFSPSCRPRLPK